MDHPKKIQYSLSLGSNLALIFLFLTGTILYLSIWSPSYSLTNLPIFPFRREQLQSCQLPSSTVAEAPQDELESALEKASMENKTVIIAVINKAYADQDMKADTTMLDIFLDSLWLGEDTKKLRDHLLLVAVDQTAYDRCRFLGLNCFRLETDGVDFMGEKLYMSHDFIKMMWRRTLFLLEVLKRGYSFIFTDMDVVWLRNPFEKLSKNETEDFQISTDMFFGDPWSEKHLINTGFYYIRSNNKTIALFDKWYSLRDNSTGQKEQDVLLDLIRGGIIGQLGLKVRFLDTLHFSGFCQDSKDFREVTTVHANCCRSITAKVTDLRAVLRDWKRFKKIMSYKRFANVNATETFRWTGHRGCWSSWKAGNKTKV
ncbi:Nucleotide-diphospho-sugar transferase [Parasponia andersonii]|uniref:Nucleotide-diphospho-sugar transferase n=1 Tax=Parasponia andersonii TaxID=3476 RepID=A0A2P5CCS1_PARAD|nr:Nucleotide-diphospho-sugar transferase [Parasponia andersonii]